jgi:uncharacterized protein YeaO (DUF488 family)
VKTNARSSVRLKRVYQTPEPSDGTRILVDRLWPRGLSKARAKLDLWLKEIAPSTELRKWFGHEPQKWSDFRRRYKSELKGHAEQLAVIKNKAAEDAVTLLFAARDQEHNEAVVLKELLERS